jgi:choline kinase
MDSMSASLLVLAAGMGSRYGGLKQLDPMRPSGETLLDYSIFDALQAGFDRIVFVIRRAFEAEFRERVGGRYEKKADVSYVFQETSSLPPGFSVEARQKPWGTGNAIWCAAEQVRTRFAAINADDFYGADAYEQLHRFFEQSPAVDSEPEFAMVGYQLGRTLSEHGSVSRGICELDDAGFLKNIRESTGLEKSGTGARSKCADEAYMTICGSEIVSMNFWGFTPAVFPLLGIQFERFLRERGDDPKAEFYIPEAVGRMVETGAARVRVLQTEGDWFGVTYREDKPLVSAALGRLVERGAYPPNLWSL